MNQLDLQQRHAVITGGASGLGFEIAARMLASGARLTLWDRDHEGLQQATHRLKAGSAESVINTFTLDVTSHAAVSETTRLTEAIAPVDILVNSAGISGPNIRLWDYPIDIWEQIININLNGTFFCCRELIPGMRKQNYGRIVNIASIAGKEGNPNASAYSASKAGVIALTKSLGKELADSGIRVNCITPAAVQTTILEQNSPEHIAFMLSKIPMGRFGTTEEIAAMVAWLASEECSFSTGAVFDLSGGRAVY